MMMAISMLHAATGTVGGVIISWLSAQLTISAKSGQGPWRAGSQVEILKVIRSIASGSGAGTHRLVNLVQTLSKPHSRTRLASRPTESPGYCTFRVRSVYH